MVVESKVWWIARCVVGLCCSRHSAAIVWVSFPKNALISGVSALPQIGSSAEASAFHGSMLALTH